MKFRLTGYTFIKDGIEFDFPFVECILSLIPVCDEVLVCECGSKDNTLDVLKKLEISHEKVRVIHYKWVNHRNIVPDIMNHCIEKSNGIWNIGLMPDEVLHENSYAEILEISSGGIPSSFNAVFVGVKHFVGNYDTRCSLYNRTVRMAKTNSSWRSVGDAKSYSGRQDCYIRGLHPRGYAPDDLYGAKNVWYFHYGYLREDGVVFLKSKLRLNETMGVYPKLVPKLKDMIRNGKCSYKELYDFDFEKNKSSKHPWFLNSDPHPKVMKERIERFSNKGFLNFK